jgi:hypothetical protein
VLKETDNTSKKQVAAKPKKTGGRSAKLQAILQRVQQRRRENEENGIVGWLIVSIGSLPVQTVV